jgi:SNF2 family DNA or RNA helicase
MTILVEQADATQVFILSDYPMRDKELIKTLPGAHYDIHDHKWYAPLTWATCRALRGIFGDKLEVGALLYDWAWEERRSRVDPAIEMRAATEADGDPDLYGFQRAGVAFMTFVDKNDCSAVALCDDMGTGKTVQTIRALAKHMREGRVVFPTIVVAPNNMTIQWRKEFEKWMPGVRARVVKGSAKQRRDIIAEGADVLIINYEGVRAHSRLTGYGSIRLKRCVVCDPTLADVPSNAQSRCENCPKELNRIGFKTVIVDEAHRMKDPKAKQTRACWSLVSEATKFKYTLTGTPIANAPHDFWPILHFLSPAEFPSRTKYVDRYCLASYNMWGGLTVIGLRDDTQAEFFSIVDPRLRRMPKEAVLPQLPKKTYSQRYVEMTKEQESAYRQMESGLIAMIGEGELAIAANPLVQLTRLMQFSSAYAQVNDSGEVKLSMPSNKIAGLMDLLNDMGEEPLVVFAQSRQLIELAGDALAKADISHGFIVGGQKPDEREAAKDAFQAGHTRVILCTIAAGGIGITLTRAAAACFLQRSWSMVDDKQAEDRVHRIGSEIHDKIEIIDIISPNTIEERQRVMLEAKGDRLEELVRDKSTLLRLLGA